MHYVKHFNINGIETKQVACIELHGKPNAATEGAVGALAIDVDSPLHDVYKCVAVNGSIYTWELLSSGLSVMSATTSGRGEETVNFDYDSLKIPEAYVVKYGDSIIDVDGYLYTVESLATTYCTAKYCGVHLGSGDTEQYVTRTELVEYVSSNNTPKMFGAVGDGVADDTTAFQSALAGNRTVYVPGGTYKLTSGLVIGDNCELELAQDAVLNFTQTTGNCITLGMLSTLRGHHATIKVPYAFAGNVIYAYSNDATDAEQNAVPPWTKWCPQWKSGRYVTDINICKANASGNHESVGGECSGTAVYLSANGNSGSLKYMWGILYSGLRIAGAFSYGIRAVNLNEGWMHEMRIDAFIDACEIGVQLEDCNNAYISAIIQPRRTWHEDESKRVKYAKHGIKLIRSTNADLSGSRVWDWDAKHSLWTKDGEYQHIAMVGDCRGAIINDFIYHSHGDTRNRIYTDNANNLKTLTILQEPIDRLFKSNNNKPYFYDGVDDVPLATEDYIDAHFTTDLVPNFTDVLSTAPDESGAIYNGKGYKTGYRIGMGTGIEVESDGTYTCTGFIKATTGDTIYTRGATWNVQDGYCGVVYYDANFNRVGSATLDAIFPDTSYWWQKYEAIENGIKLEIRSTVAAKGGVYVRLNFRTNEFSENTVISVNNEIKYTTSGFLNPNIKVHAENVVGLAGGGGSADRTHWSEEGKVQVSSFATYISQLNSGYGFYTFVLGFNEYVESLPLTSVYSIVYDGVEYTNLATVELSGTHFFGNLYYLNALYGTSFANTGEPFLLTGDTMGMMMFTLDTVETMHSLEIYIDGTLYHPIDKRYIPQIPVINLAPYCSNIEYGTSIKITDADFVASIHQIMKTNDMVKVECIHPQWGEFSFVCTVLRTTSVLQLSASFFNLISWGNEAKFRISNVGNA